MCGLLCLVARLFDAVVDPRLQQHRIEGLGQIVGGSKLDATNDTVDVLDGRDHHHRYIAQRGIGAQLLEHTIAVELRHHDVEEDEIDRSLTHLFERLAPILGGHDVFVTAGFEPHRQRKAVIVVVVDDQNDRIRHPRPTPNVLCGRCQSRQILGIIRYSKLAELAKKSVGPKPRAECRQRVSNRGADAWGAYTLVTAADISWVANGSSGVDLPVIRPHCERQVSALLPRCRASRRRSLDRTHSRRSGLSVRTGLDAPEPPLNRGWYLQNLPTILSSFVSGKR